MEKKERTKGRPASFLFYTNSSPIFKEIYELFFKKGENGLYVKHITQELIDNLPMSPYVLALCFLDDGSVRNDYYSGKLACMCFPKDEQELLVQYFEKWGITCKTTLQDSEKNTYYISFPVKGFPRLIEIIEPLVKEVPAMAYKLNSACKPCND